MATHVKNPTPLEAPPRHRGRIIALSVLGGLLLSIAWSYEFVDTVIGQNVAESLLGHDPESAITGSAAAVLFAFVSGLAGTFTACNIAAFGAMAPMLSESADSRRDRFIARWKPFGWLVAGTLGVALVYGAIVGVTGTALPQFTNGFRPGEGIPAFIIQAMVTFGLIGVAFLYLGLAALNVVPDPLRRIEAQFPHVRMLVMGGLIGLFLVGRPFPMFRHLFHYAAEERDPFLGAFAFGLQSLGNIALMAVIFALLLSRVGAPLRRWMLGTPGRLTTVTAASLLLFGSFTLIYWTVRILNAFDMAWFPTAPWNA